MSFTSGLFLIGILPWFMAMFFLLRRKDIAKTIMIFLMNCIFYIWGGTNAFVFLCVYSLIIWFFTTLIRVARNRVSTVCFSIAAAGPLLFVKYFNGTNLFVPLGISFFTFQAMSLIVDMYRKKITGKVSLPEVFLYLSFFPTVTSGPIIRFEEFKNGLSNKKAYDFGKSFERIATGLCKKVLIADKLGLLADYYFNGTAIGNHYSVIGLWIGSIAYTLQLYFDFSGYSDMAIGIGSMMGFEIRENFNKPYRAVSISDFWKRWHISLTAWFRDYIYIPLGGNRCGKGRHIFNMFVVWLITGAWHGADLSFIIWGMGYFILLTLEKYIPAINKTLKGFAGHLYTLFFVNLLWVPFRAADLKLTGLYLKGLFGLGGAGGVILETRTIRFLPFFALAILLCFPLEKLYNRFRDKKVFVLLRNGMMVLFTLLAICAVVNATYAPYIYGNF